MHSLASRLHGALPVLLIVAACGSTAHESVARPTPATRPAENNTGGEALRDQPDRYEVMAALRTVQTQVEACGGGQHGLAMTRIKVLGATGRVSGAEVISGVFFGTPVADCISRAARAAQFPRFRNEAFLVGFPFRI